MGSTPITGNPRSYASERVRHNLNILSVLLLAAAVSFDSLAIGVTYGMAKIQIPIASRLVLSLISALFLLGAMTIGNIVMRYVSPLFAEAVGGGILVLLGAYSLWRSAQAPENPPSAPAVSTHPHIVWKLRIPFLGLIINVIKEPLAADYDGSKIISVQESLILGFALALDAFAAGIGAAILGFPATWTAVAVMIANLGFVTKGLHIGQKINRHTSRPLRYLPGAVIILIGVTKMLG